MIDYKVKLKKVKEPQKDCSGINVALTDETIKERQEKVLAKMRERGLDQLVVYGDVEHCGNFEYLVGYFTRFEEALLVINANGEFKLVLGNENLNKVSKARITASAIHATLFSLPNQPTDKNKTFKELLIEAGINEGSRIGIVGWKMFTSSIEDNKKMFDVPYFIVNTIKQIVKNDDLITNEADLFIGEDGTRTTNNANEIAHYEFGAALASDCILDAMNKIEVGVSNLEIGDTLIRNGQHTSIVTIATSGSRFVKANMFPDNHKVELAEPISLTVGYRGGSSSRSSFIVNDESQLPDGQKDYIEAIAIPYFKAYVKWIEEVEIGMTGGEIFNKVDEILPRSKYGWSLCPGHLTAEEEWMSSPIYEGSKEKIRSGMLMQIDIIPCVAGYQGVSAESTVLIADDKLKLEIKTQYPDMWNRMQERTKYIKEELGVNLSKDILPMCSTLAYLRPYLLAKDIALAIEED